MIHGFFIKDMPVFIWDLYHFENILIIFLYYFYNKKSFIYDDNST